MHIVDVSSKITKIDSAFRLAITVKIIFQVIRDSQGSYSPTNIILIQISLSITTDI